MDGMQLSRRGLLQAGGALVVSFAAGGAKPAAAWTRQARRARAGGRLPRDRRAGARHDLFRQGRSRHRPAHRASCRSPPRSSTCRWPRSTVVEGDTALTPDQGPTYGSLGIQIGGVQLRQAAATARALLGWPRAPARPAGGDAAHRGRRGDRAGRAAQRRLCRAGRRQGFDLPSTPAPLKPPEARTIVGKPVPRLDIPRQGDGPLPYVHDITLPGMLHGRVGAAAGDGRGGGGGGRGLGRRHPGIVKVVHEKGFVGVVAQTEWAAIKAQAALKVRWIGLGGLPDQAKLWEHVRATPVAQRQVTSEKGDAGRGASPAPRRSSRPATISPSTPMARWARPAPSPSSRTAG